MKRVWQVTNIVLVNSSKGHELVKVECLGSYCLNETVFNFRPCLKSFVESLVDFYHHELEKSIVEEA